MRRFVLESYADDRVVLCKKGNANEVSTNRLATGVEG
jgi:hypothetical protein